jgi:hypothetical protein
VVAPGAMPRRIGGHAAVKPGSTHMANRATATKKATLTKGGDESATPARPGSQSPSPQTLAGLDWLNFFLADVQTGVGPFFAIYLAGPTCGTRNLSGSLSPLGDLRESSPRLPRGPWWTSFGPSALASPRGWLHWPPERGVWSALRRRARGSGAPLGSGGLATDRAHGLRAGWSATVGGSPPRCRGGFQAASVDTQARSRRPE